MAPATASAQLTSERGYVRGHAVYLCVCVLSSEGWVHTWVCARVCVCVSVSVHVASKACKSFCLYRAKPMLRMSAEPPLTFPFHPGRQNFAAQSLFAWFSIYSRHCFHELASSVPILNALSCLSVDLANTRHLRLFLLIFPSP